MKIILLKDVKKIGRKYDVKDVADGYAINSLIPAKIAVPATPGFLKTIEEKKKQDNITKEQFKKAFEYALTKLPEGKLHIAGKVNEKGHLFAGITKTHIIDEFKKETGVELSADHFELDKSIKDVGEHKIDVEVEGQKYKLVVLVKSA